jgi:hypothetical protein
MKDAPLRSSLLILDSQFTFKVKIKIMFAKCFYSLQERSHEMKKELVSYVEDKRFSYSSIPQQQQQNTCFGSAERLNNT